MLAWGLLLFVDVDGDGGRADMESAPTGVGANMVRRGFGGGLSR